MSIEWVPGLRNNEKRPKKKKNCYFKAKSFNLSLVFATLLWSKIAQYIRNYSSYWETFWTG